MRGLLAVVSLHSDRVCRVAGRRKEGALAWFSAVVGWFACFVVWKASPAKSQRRGSTGLLRSRNLK